MEQWIDAPRFPNYEVSTYGNVRNKSTKRMLKPFPDRYGYLRLSIGTVDNVYIHRLVCEAFYGLPSDRNAQVNHIDNDRQNNHVLNLEWCTPRENITWGVRRGNIDPIKASMRASEVNQRPVRIIETDQTFPSVKACADFIGVPPTNVSRCLAGCRRGQALHGYHLEYVAEGE